jgi:hypothetical protein
LIIINMKKRKQDRTTLYLLISALVVIAALFLAGPSMINPQFSRTVPQTPPMQPSTPGQQGDIVFPFQSGEWPLKYSGYQAFHYQVVDMIWENVDGKKGKEILYPFYVTPDPNEDGHKLNLVNHKGISLKGWPVNSDPNSFADGFSLFPSIGDIDGDGEMELVDAEEVEWNEFEIYAWDGNGQLINGWPVKVESERIKFISLGDLNNDGVLEIVALGDKEKIYAFHGDGKTVNGWPAKMDPSYSTGGGTISLADIDKDGNLEVIVTLFKIGFGYEPSPIYVFEHDGTMKWKKQFAGAIMGAAIGNMDNDDYMEIVTHYRIEGDWGYTTVLNHDSSTMPGWTPKPWSWGGNPILTDLDKDGSTDIVIGAGFVLEPWNGVLIVYNSDGSVKWEIKSDSEYYTFSEPRIADVDGDKKPEIIFANPTNIPPAFNTIAAINHDGTPLKSGGWPINVPGNDNWCYSVGVDDIDDDGDVEVLCWTYVYISPNDFNNFYVWDLPYKHDPDSLDWPMKQHDPQHTGFYTK